MSRPVHVLLISGSLRTGSTNTAVLRTAAAVAPDGVSTVTYEGMGELPLFNPDDDREGAPVAGPVRALRERVAAADALLVCTPEYAGALPGALKNLLEWTIGDAGTYGKPVAWINASGPGSVSGGADAHDSLRKVLGYVGADIVEAACSRIPLTRDAIGPDGTIADTPIRAQVAGVLDALADHVAADARSQPSAVATVEDADSAFFAALLAQDLPGLESLLADDFLIVHVSTGEVHPRAAFLDAVRERSVVFESIERRPAETLVRRYDRVTTVVGRTTMSFSAGGSTVRTESRYTHVFTTDGAKWRLHSAQGTPILAPDPTSPR